MKEIPNHIMFSEMKEIHVSMCRNKIYLIITRYLHFLIATSAIRKKQIFLVVSWFVFSCNKALWIFWVFRSILFLF